MNPLVTPAWLAGRLAARNPGDPGPVIFDATLPPVGVTPAVDTRARYLAQHIPGALFFDIEELSDHATTLPHMLAAPESFAKSMTAVGVTDRTVCVVYEQEGVFSAPRAWWMLHTYGASEVYVLDGGLRAWIEADLPTAAGPVQRSAGTGSFTAMLDQAAVRHYAQVQEAIKARSRQAEPKGMIASEPAQRKHIQILDARPAGRFAGSTPEPRPGISSGHMPGAISVPFTEVVEAGRLKDAASLRALFAARRVKLDQPITTTCGSGVTAAVILLALVIAGAEQVSLYDGSWAEYAQRPGARIETTA